MGWGRMNLPGQNLTYRIVENLGTAIVTGKYSGTGVLPTETELSQNFGASRTVLREAAKMLTVKGLLGSRPRRGI